MSPRMHVAGLHEILICLPPGGKGVGGSISLFFVSSRTRMSSHTKKERACTRTRMRACTSGCRHLDFFSADIASPRNPADDSNASGTSCATSRGTPCATQVNRSVCVAAPFKCGNTVAKYLKCAGRDTTGAFVSRVENAGVYTSLFVTKS